MSEWLSSKRPKITNIGKDVEKREPSYTVSGNVYWCGYYAKQWRIPGMGSHRVGHD